MKKSLKRHKAGNIWNEMSITDRENWLRGVGHRGWANESWWNLTNSIRELFVNHVEFSSAAYAYR